MQTRVLSDFACGIADFDGPFVDRKKSRTVIGNARRRPCGASHGLLRDVLARRWRMLAALALWLEYESVLKRPEK